jgi:DNA-directed RNA polymerase specialized sigma24 family protein
MNSIMLVFAIFTDSEFKKIKKGDPESIEKLYLHYRDRIFTFLLKKTGGNVDAANDILSETFAEVLASVSRLKNRENIGGWVFGIACNVFKGYII